MRRHRVALGRETEVCPMRLVERHVIKRADHRYAAIDRAAFASKNLYNKALVTW